MAEHWRAQLMNAGESEFHLGLDADGAGEAAVTRLRYQIVEQCGFADSGFTAQHEHATPSAVHVLEEPIECAALVAAAAEFRNRKCGGRTHRQSF